MKLNLGCRFHRIEGFTNIDIDESIHPDIVADATKLESFKDNSVEEIYASHLLEHIDREQRINVLTKWYKLLKLGGILWIVIPDCKVLKTAPDEIFSTKNYACWGKTIEERRANIIIHSDGLYASKVGKMMISVGFSYTLAKIPFSKCSYIISKWKGQTLTKGIK